MLRMDRKGRQWGREGWTDQRAVLAVAWAESAEQGMTLGETWTCTVVLNSDTVHQQNNTAPGSERERGREITTCWCSVIVCNSWYTLHCCCSAQIHTHVASVVLNRIFPKSQRHQRSSNTRYHYHAVNHVNLCCCIRKMCPSTHTHSTRVHCSC